MCILAARRLQPQAIPQEDGPPSGLVCMHVRAQGVASQLQAVGHSASSGCLLQQPACTEVDVLLSDLLWNSAALHWPDCQLAPATTTDSPNSCSAMPCMAIVPCCVACRILQSLHFQLLPAILCSACLHAHAQRHNLCQMLDWTQQASRRAQGHAMRPLATCVCREVVITAMGQVYPAGHPVEPRVSAGARQGAGCRSGCWAPGSAACGGPGRVVARPQSWPVAGTVHMRMQKDITAMDQAYPARRPVEPRVSAGARRRAVCHSGCWAPASAACGGPWRVAAQPQTWPVAGRQRAPHSCWPHSARSSAFSLQLLDLYCAREATSSLVRYHRR